MNKKLWGGRFADCTHPEVEAFTASIHYDQVLILDDILGSIAHAGMLAHCKIIATEEGALLQQGLRTIAQKALNHQLEFTTADEDVHMNVERLLKEEIGAVAGKLHTARSRNDQVALDLHLYLRRQTVACVDLLNQIQSQLLALAMEHRAVILPGYTHLQRAQPISLAQHWLAYVSMFARDSQRLQDSFARVNLCPLGAGALSGSSFAIDKTGLAQTLGFDGIYLNTMDAISDRDFVIEFLAASSLIMMHLSRLSEEMILWSSQEFNFIHIGDAYCTGSSMMPQKKNPDVAEITRGKTGRVYGSLMSLLTLLKGLPLSYNRDLQEDKEPLFDTIKTVQACLHVYSGLLKNIKVNEQVMKKATQQGFLNATALAEYLVKKGVIFREAHAIVGNLVAHCTQKQVCLDDLSLTQLQEFSNIITADVYEALMLEKIVITNDSSNAQGVSQITTELAARQQQIELSKDWVAQKQKLFDEVARNLGMLV